MSAKELLTVLILGGVCYGLTELAWRGRTHWSMVLTGGACFLFMYLAQASSLPPLGRYALCAADITAVEFLVGALVNIRLGWGVWDYTKEPMNLYGQICVRYTVLWFLLSVPGCALAGLLRRALTGQ